MLSAELLRMSGVRFETVKVDSISDLSERVIVNCSGLGSRQLVSDAKLRPMIGNLLITKDQSLPYDELQYMVLTQAREGLLYYFPKHSLSIAAEKPKEAGDMGVLGGSCIETKNETERHEEEFERIIRDARWFFYGEEDEERLV